MELNGVVSKIVGQLKDLKLEPHTKLAINGNARIWYGNKPYSVAAYHRVIERQKNKSVEDTIIGSSKQHDKDNNQFFDLTTQNVKDLRQTQNDCCKYCAVSMQTKNRNLPDGLTIDRTDSSKGHTKENCVLSSLDLIYMTICRVQ